MKISPLKFKINIKVFNSNLGYTKQPNPKINIFKKYTAYQLTIIFIYYKLDPISDKESSQCLLKMHGM